MASQAQIQANRKNAQRSTGPRTAQGKARVALNALSHGLTAVKVVAGEEDMALFGALRAQLAREWRPGSVLEIVTVDRIAELVWQLRRVAGVEVMVLERKFPAVMPGPPPKSPVLDMMARDFAKPNPTLLRVQLYQNRLERALHRAMRELRDLQIERQMQDERGEEFEDEPLPAPLPGERLGEGIQNPNATDRQIDKAEAGVSSPPSAGDAPSSPDSASPHLTSPRGRGTGEERESDTANPISLPSVGDAPGSAASISPHLTSPRARGTGGVNQSDKTNRITLPNTVDAPALPASISPHLASPRGRGTGGAIQGEKTNPIFAEALAGQDL